MIERTEHHNAEMDREFSRACAAAAYRLPQEYTAKVKIEVSATVLVRRGRWGWEPDADLAVTVADMPTLCPGVCPDVIGDRVLKALKAAAVRAAEKQDESEGR